MIERSVERSASNSYASSLGMARSRFPCETRQARADSKRGGWYEMRVADVACVVWPIAMRRLRDRLLLPGLDLRLLSGASAGVRCFADAGAPCPGHMHCRCTSKHYRAPCH